MKQNRDAALHWASLGFRFFPVHSKGTRMKRPYIKDWENQASTDTKRIEIWWKRFPDAAVGLPCGQENGLTVVDCDPDPSKGSKLWEAELAKYFPDWRDNPYSRTPSGGVHIFFGHKEGLKNDAKVLPSIDVRTEGGYVLAPISKTEAGTYEWAVEPDLELSIVPEMPESLFQALTQPECSKSDSARQDATLENSAYGKAALKRELETLRQKTKGGRNTALSRAIFCLGQLVKSGDLNESEVRFELTLAALEIGLDENEIQATIESGLEAGKMNPRQNRSPESKALLNSPTQDNIASIAAQELKGRMLYMRDARAWFRWEGTHWQQDHFATAENLVRELAREANHGNKASPASNSFIEGCTKLLEKDARLMGLLSDFDEDPNFLNTPDGLLNLCEIKLMAHTPQNRVTKITKAKRGTARGSRFEDFIDEITLGDVELQKFLQTALGACFGGTIESHWLLFLVGNGRNGKSLMLNFAAAASMTAEECNRFKDGHSCGCRKESPNPDHWLDTAWHNFTDFHKAY